MATNVTPQAILSLPVQQIATTQQLGPFVKTYKSIIRRTMVLIGSIVLFVFGVVFLVVGIAGSVISLPIIGLLFIAMPIYWRYTVLKIAKQQIHLFQYGMVIENRNQVQAFPWHQVSEILQSVTRRYRYGSYVTIYLYTLRRADGYKMQLNNFTKNVAELGPIVAKGVTQVQVPRALSLLHAGQTLTFAPFSINLQGISRQQEFLPWTQIQTVSVKKGYVKIKKIGTSRNWANVPVAKIPNFLVFTVIADEMRK
jgi:hypothetical protein